MSVSIPSIPRPMRPVKQTAPAGRYRLPTPEARADQWFVATYVEGELVASSLTRPLSFREADRIRESRDAAEPDANHVVVPESGRAELVRVSWPRREAADALVEQFLAEVILR